MGTLTPNSTIYCFQGVPLNNTYSETYYKDYDSTKTLLENEQMLVNDFVSNYPYQTYTNHMYQRVSEGIIRLCDTGVTNSVDINFLSKCNYMIFKNDASIQPVTPSATPTPRVYENKYYFAFITNIEYVNDNAVNIYYEIDVMQTWLFSMVLKACYVEREHVTDDTIGSNTLPEPIDFGELICQNREMIGGSLDENRDWFHGYKVLVFWVTSDHTKMLGGVFSGCQISQFKPTSSGADGLTEFLSTYAEDPQKIVSIVMCPQGFCPSSVDPDDFWIESILKQFATERTLSLNGHTPRNKKLLTFPYVCMNVDVQTDSKDFKYEWFEDPTNISFSCYCSPSTNPEIVIMPLNYNHQSINNTGDALLMNDFPQCSYPIDSYRQWLAMKATNQNLDLIKQIGSGVIAAGTLSAGVASENPTAIAIGASGVLSSMVGAAQMRNQMIIDSTHGTTVGGRTGSSTFTGTKQRCILVKHMSIKKEYAEIIDDFFDRYGYACNRVKVPNIHARKAFSYVKTNGAVIQGNIPASDLTKIKKCFDSGIAFFKTLTNVGDYSVDNTLV